MQFIFGIAYFAVGLLQLFAVADGIAYSLRVGGLVSFILAALATYVPLLGSGLGVYGAVHAWNWSIWQAGILFFWYVPVLIVFMGASWVFDRR